MISLFVDTHSKDLNIGLSCNDNLLGEVKIKDLETHSNLFLCKIDELLKSNNILPSDVNKIIVVNGPGSFTGIRIAVTFAKVFAWGLKKDITTISSLTAYALSIKECDYIVSLIDARRGYVYASIFDNSMNVVLNESYMTLDKLLDEVNNLNGIKKFVGVCNVNGLKIIKPDLNIINIINYCKNKSIINPHFVNPNYLKKTEAEEKNDKSCN